MAFLRAAAFAVVASATVAVPTAMGVARADVAPPRPNFLVIVTDDQSWSTFDRSVMPNVYSRIVDQGVLFRRGYVNTSLCCPSRSQILTGLYEHHTGVDNNQTMLTRPTIVEGLHDAGYRTMLSGKYLNSWDCSPRPEFDRWVCGDPPRSNMMDPTFNIDGTLTHFSGHTSDIEADFVTDFVANTPSEEPFFAMYTPFSPHVQRSWDDRCTDVAVDPYRPASFDEDTTVSGKPAYVPRDALSTTKVAHFDNRYRRMRQAVQCLDGSIGRLLDGLGDRADDTVVVFLSDNGFLHGEHHLGGKIHAYEPSVRVPFAIRFPRLVAPAEAFASDAFALNVDIAPTFAELAGIPWGADGRSLVPILDGSAASVRDAALIEHCEGVWYPCTGSSDVRVPSFWGLVGERYKYVEYVTDERELYDLAADPDEMVNLVDDPAYAELTSSLAASLAELHAPPEPETTIVSGPPAEGADTRVTFRYFTQSRFATYRCRLDADGVAGEWFPCNGQTVPLGTLAPGPYTFNVAGVDERGVADESPAQRSFVVSGRPGTNVSIDSAPAARVASGAAHFEFSSPDPSASFECRFGPTGSDGSFEPCSSPVDLGSLADATYSFQVRSVQGDQVNEPAEWRFDVDTTGPAVTFDAAPDPATRATEAIFRFHGAEPTRGVATCAVDETPPVACPELAFSLPSVSEGSHTLHVELTDDLGNRSAAQYAWAVDHIAPALTFTEAPPAVSSSSSAKFVGAANEPVTVKCALDGPGFRKCRLRQLFTGLGDGRHSFRFAAIDAAGNKAGTLRYEWVVDTRPPVITLTSEPPAATQDGTATFAFGASEKATFRCSWDGGVFGACVSPATTLGLAEGTHTFTVKATDAAGSSSSLSRSWTVDRTAPGVAIASAPTDPTKATDAHFEFSSPDAGARLSCALDDADAAACTSPVALTNVPEGAHVFHVTATDEAGNSTSASAAWKVDLTAPSITFASVPTGTTRSEATEIAFAIDDADATVICSLDGADPSPCTSPVAVDALGDGEHTFVVAAADAAGNERTESASWRVDAVAPTATIVSGPDNTTFSNSATFEFVSDDESATFECSIDDEPVTSCSSPWTLTDLSVGGHTFTVTAVDAVGNAGQPADRTWLVLGAAGPRVA